MQYEKTILFIQLFSRYTRGNAKNNFETLKFSVLRYRVDDSSDFFSQVLQNNVVGICVAIEIRTIQWHETI